MEGLRAVAQAVKRTVSRDQPSESTQSILADSPADSYATGNARAGHSALARDAQAQRASAPSTP